MIKNCWKFLIQTWLNKTNNFISLKWDPRRNRHKNSKNPSTVSLNYQKKAKKQKWNCSQRARRNNRRTIVVFICFSGFESCMTGVVPELKTVNKINVQIKLSHPNTSRRVLSYPLMHKICRNWVATEVAVDGKLNDCRWNSNKFSFPGNFAMA